MKRLAAALGLLVLAACDHAQPFGAPDLGPNQPFSAAFPRRLTFSALGDVQPAWLPGDSGIIYSRSLAQPDGDHCLGILPPEGGQLLRSICHASPHDADSTNALFMPAPGPQGLWAYLRNGSAIGATAPASSEVVLAAPSTPDPGRVLVRFPYTTAGGTLVAGAEDLRWLGAGSLVYRAGLLIYHTLPPIDTTFTPIDIERIDLVGDSVQLSVVPGTVGAASLTTDAAGALYFTLPGDSRVYRLPDGASAATVFYDFGATGVPAQIQVSGGVLIAVVGDSVYVVHDTTGAPAPLTLPDSLQVVGVALSAAGDRVVVAGSLPGARPDLWLVDVP